MAADHAVPVATPAPHPILAACELALSAHVHLRTELQALDAELAARTLTPRFTAPWAHFIRSLESHLAVEEEAVFPALAAMAAGQTPETGYEEPLHGMRYELDEMRTIADALRVAAGEAGPLEGRILTLLDELEEHATKEEERLFPMAMELLERWSSGPLPAAAEPTSGPAASATPEPVGTVLRRTSGHCHTCLQAVPAEVIRSETEVNLVKHCPTHGSSVQLLSRAPAYWEDLDRYYFKVNKRAYPQRDYILRMTERCNLACPICLAKANTEDTPDLDLSGLQALLSERRGIKVDLMAAEPTLREDLADWIRKVKATGNIAALHTNGLKLADYDYARSLKDAGVDEVFLQFDGFDEVANKALRGRPLVKARMKALENLRKLGIATSLIVVVARGLNEAQVGTTYRFALQPENDHIREVFFLGLRVLGSARDAGTIGGNPLSEMAMMPDEIIDLLCAQEPGIHREDIRRFNRLYFALLSAFAVKKCLYVQHYLVARDGQGHGRPMAELMDLKALEAATDRYAALFEDHPVRAKASLLAALGRHGVTRDSARMLMDLVKLQLLFQSGMNLGAVPPRFLLLGFITACDPHNFDADVSVNCGKGELSRDGGFIESGAEANVRREARFDETDRRPGRPFQKPGAP